MSRKIAGKTKKESRISEKARIATRLLAPNDEFAEAVEIAREELAMAQDANWDNIVAAYESC